MSASLDALGVTVADAHPFTQAIAYAHADQHPHPCPIALHDVVASALTSTGYPKGNAK